MNLTRSKQPGRSLRSSRSRFWKSRWSAGVWWFLLPYLLGSFFLLLLPLLATALLAFTEFSSIQPPTWVGLENFRRLAASDLVRMSLQNSLIFVALAVPLRVTGALLLALLLQRESRPFGLFRAAVYVPTVIPEAAYALIWLWLLNPVYGPLNLILEGIGLPALNWLTDPSLARVSIVILSVFQLGEGFVLLLAGLQTIPRSFYDAAAIDGADAWQSFWRITLPIITPWLVLLTSRDILLSLQNTFAPSFIITYGGPYYATMFVPLLVSEMAFDYLELGLAAALLLLVLVAIGLLVMVLNDLVLGERESDD